MAPSIIILSQVYLLLLDECQLYVCSRLISGCSENLESEVFVNATALSVISRAAKLGNFKISIAVSMTNTSKKPCSYLFAI